VNGIEFIKLVYFIYHVGVNENSTIVFEVFCGLYVEDVFILPIVNANHVLVIFYIVVP
jgi:hypothetical protein